MTIHQQKWIKVWKVAQVEKGVTRARHSTTAQKGYPLVTIKRIKTNQNKAQEPALALGPFGSVVLHSAMAGTKFAG